MPAPTLLTAFETMNARKAAAGLGGPDDDRTIARLDDHRGIMAGSDLDPRDVNAASRTAAATAAPALAEATELEEFVLGVRGLWVDGVLTGLELARQRAAHEDNLERLERDERDLRAARRLAAVRDVLEGAAWPPGRPTIAGVVAELTETIDELGGLR